MNPPPIVRVALDHPLASLYDYRWQGEAPPEVGRLVSVPFGKRSVVGLVFEIATQTEVSDGRLRDVEIACASMPPLSRAWCELIAFAASYYQRALGEVAMPALPTPLREPERWERLFARERRYRLTQAGDEALPEALPTRAAALRRLAQGLRAPAGLGPAQARALHPKAIATLDEWQANGWAERLSDEGGVPGSFGASGAADVPVPAATPDQLAALAEIEGAAGFKPFLLYGVTGSGKTEVYLRALARLLEREPDAQALVLVPEINLTPQFERTFRTRFGTLPADSIVSLHSGLAEGERTRNWLAAHTGRARILLGTRLAVLASLPRLALIVVDEEHDPAYKQQEGLRYSARDLAIWRAKQLDIPIMLGSATPSLESWQQAEHGRYRRLTLATRAVPDAVLPAIRLIDQDAEKRGGVATVEGMSATLIAALRARLERGEQSLVFVNRRGYAPVLACDACGWLAGCPRCSAYTVLHKVDRTLRCHHCGWESRIPRACPECGNIDLAPLGRGTQRVEEALAGVVPGARVLRIDADSTRRKGSAEALFDNVHAGDVDILIGTQMIAKGHDFQRVTLVGVLNADAALFSHDFRASERLFAQLMQVSGRAGRAGLPGEVMIQTRYAGHALYGALVRHDYPGFARAALGERREARLPPFAFQALLRADGRTLEAALAFLDQAAAALDGLPGADQVTRYDAVPLTIVKVMNVHRAQLLLESGSRAALQATLRAWQPLLRELKGVLRWSVEVDPLDI
ncbi:primosomal protein N' [Pararobbsia alpina]|uniref:Replication restart protein PriA n=1 Tax=Pararobbsia alpina TaxID=621374 RepID=A0A6S7AVS0_9BURK|nr:primosomal protein N' [Pararobbsia alpina]CAB3778815.1 Primosomal protein N' [Pararobbsia alpina]